MDFAYTKSVVLREYDSDVYKCECPVIEFDFDGVLYDMLKASRRQSSILDMYDFGDSCVTKYDFSNCPAIIRKAVFDTFNNINTFIDDTCFYDGVETFLCSLFEYAERYYSPFKLVIHTYVRKQKFAKIRCDWIFSKISAMLLRGKYPCNLTVICDYAPGGKQILKSDILIEDNLGYIAKVKDADMCKHCFAPGRNYVYCENTDNEILTFSMWYQLFSEITWCYSEFLREHRGT